MTAEAEATISLVLATDEHYVIHLAALLKSIEVNHKTGEKILAYVIDDGIKPASKRRIEESVSPDMFRITWVAARAIIPVGTQLPADQTSYPFTTYLRIFIERIVPAGTQKVLFLDVDMLLLRDISELYHTDLAGHTIAAVQDSRILTFGNEWGGIRNYAALGLPAETKYFNAGMMLINLPEWVAQGISQKVMATLHEHIKIASYADQYGLNIVLANKWLPLDERWNYFASGELENPYLIHFVSRKPFYTSYSSNPAYQQLFYHYLAQTPWRNAKPVGELHRAIKKIGNVLSKFK